MKMKLFLTAAMAGGLLLCAQSQDAAKQEVKGKVTASKLNVRVKPNQNYTSIGFVKKGDEVNIIKASGEWYEIQAPSDAAVWIAADAVKDGKVVKSTALRGGPGVEHQAYTQVEPGKELKVLDASRKLWLKVAPLPELTAWVSKRYIDVPTAEQGKVPGNKAATTSGATQKKPTIKDPEPTDLPYIADTAKKVTIEGVIQPVQAGAVVTHALCKSFTELSAQCYLLSKQVKLDTYAGKEVQLQGTERRVRGWSVPVVEVESVTVKK